MDCEWSLFGITSRQLLTAPISQTTGDAQKQIQDTLLTGPGAICSDSSGKKEWVIKNVERVGSNKTRGSKF